MSAPAKLTVEKLLKMSQDELDDLYTNSPSGDIPDGDCEGTVIVAPGTVMTPIKAKLMHLFGWQGKVFDKKKGRLVNKILPLRPRRWRTVRPRECGPTSRRSS